jgi:hypothetical protein
LDELEGEIGLDIRGFLGIGDAKAARRPDRSDPRREPLRERRLAPLESDDHIEVLRRA